MAMILMRLPLPMMMMMLIALGHEMRRRKSWSGRWGRGERRRLRQGEEDRNSVLREGGGRIIGSGAGTNSATWINSRTRNNRHTIPAFTCISGDGKQQPSSCQRLHSVAAINFRCGISSGTTTSAPYN